MKSSIFFFLCFVLAFSTAWFHPKSVPNSGWAKNKLENQLHAFHNGVKTRNQNLVTKLFETSFANDAEVREFFNTFSNYKFIVNFARADGLDKIVGNVSMLSASGAVMKVVVTIATNTQSPTGWKIMIFNGI